jgi:arylsulfatase
MQLAKIRPRLFFFLPFRVTSVRPLRRLLTGGLAVVAMMATTEAAPREAAPAPRRPNIILIMPDDIGYGDFACHGNPVIRTPNVDRLAAESVRFTQFHVSPTCAPTRAALLTGRHEFKNGVTHTIFERERLTPKAVTLADLLHSAGYRTGLFGKWHLGDERAYWPDRRGFDEFYMHGAGGIGQTFAGSCGDAPSNSNINPVLLHNGRFVKTEGYCTDLFFNQAMRWMDQQRLARRPFFAMITPNAAHAPLVLPEEYYRPYLGRVPDLTAKFFGMIENIDSNVGRLLTQLDAWGITQETLIIFLTDNGGTVGVGLFNAGMRGAKNTPYQGATRVPSFWRWPAGFTGGVDCAALTAHLDVLPTLAEMLSINLNRRARQQVEGRSLWPLLQNPRAPWADRTLVTHVGRWPAGQHASAKYDGCAIQNSRFTLVNNQALYDLTTDPGESHNVIAEFPDDVARLRQAYHRWWTEVQPLLVNEKAVGPKINPLKKLYWRQFGGGPDQALLQAMDPQEKFRPPPPPAPNPTRSASPNPTSTPTPTPRPPSSAK